MKKRNKKALETIPQQYQEHDLILPNKTYTIKELNAVFNINSLMLVESKSELIKYERMAVETGVKQFKEVVDKVYRMKYAI
jgi:hypothetical protein